MLPAGTANGKPGTPYPSRLGYPPPTEDPPAAQRAQRAQRTQRTQENPGSTATPPGTLRSLRCNDEVLRKSLPTEPGDWKRAAFRLARELKAIPDLADLPPAALEPLVRRWHQDAVQAAGARPFEETLLDFFHAWERVRYPAGCGPLEDAFQRATETPLPAAARGFEQPGLQWLVALCVELQRMSGDAPFFLGCREAGGLLNVDPAVAWRWLDLLVRLGVLEKVSTGSKQSKQANEYRYIGDREEGDRTHG